jgi:hypothetical protein
MADRVEVQGARELRASLKHLGADLGDFAAVHTQVASFVGAVAARGVPNTTGRGTGWLSSSWRPGAAKTSASVRFGGAGTPYANAVHWGTGARPGRRGPHNIRPSRFVTNAAADTESTWVGWYLTEVQKMVDRVRGA